jgi:omega-amidase
MISTAIKLYNPNILVLPEYFQTPANLKDLDKFVEDGENSETLGLLKQQALKYSIYIVGGTIPVYFSDKSKVYNTCYCINKKGEVKTSFKKLHLFDVNIPGKICYTESKKITRGDSFGVFETEFAKIGIGICYDMRFPEYALCLRKEHDIDMLVYPAAFSSVTGPPYWELLGRSRAVDNQVYVALCSPSRNYENPEDYQAYGHSMVIDPFGSVITTTGIEESIIYTKIDPSKLDEIRNSIPTWRQKRWDMYEFSIKK